MKKTVKRCRVLILSALFALMLTSQAFAIHTSVGVPSSHSYVSKNYKGKVYIFAGDSRTMYMTKTGSVKNNCAFAWVNGGSVSVINRKKNGPLKSRLDSLIKKYKKQGCVVILNFGVNGNSNPAKNAKNIISTYNAWIKAYPGVKFYVESVNPTAKTKTSYKNANVIAVNKVLKSKFGSRYIDMYSYLISNKLVNTSNGKGTTDDLHYKTSVYTKIIQRTKSVAK